MILSERENFYKKKWVISDFVTIADTHSARIFKVQRAQGYAALKIFKTLGRIDESSSAAALAHFAGNGATKLFAHDEGALLTEFADGGDLCAVSKRGDDNAATKIAIEVLAKLHSAPLSLNAADFIPMERYFRSLLEPKIEVPAAHHKLFSEAQSFARALIRDPRDEKVLHGDFHHENILFGSERGWLAIDPKGVVGERTYDAANLFYNPGVSGFVINKDRIARMAKILAESLAFDRERLLTFAIVHGCLSAAWSIEDGQNPSHALRIAQLLRTFLRDAAV